MHNFKNVNTKNMNAIKNNIMDIAQENLFMYKRLRDRPPTYDVNKLLSDYYKNQYYKKNACRYPSIDFFKEKKNFSYDTKRVNRKVIHNCRTENNYFPKFTVTSNFKRNTFEGFCSVKNRKIKERKKKFKDFNFKDLKQLKENKNKNIEKEININKNKENENQQLTEQNNSNINSNENNNSKEKISKDLNHKDSNKSNSKSDDKEDIKTKNKKKKKSFSNKDSTSNEKNNKENSESNNSSDSKNEDTENESENDEESDSNSDSN